MAAISVEFSSIRYNARQNGIKTILHRNTTDKSYQNFSNPAGILGRTVRAGCCSGFCRVSFLLVRWNKVTLLRQILSHIKRWKKYNMWIYGTRKQYKNLYPQKGRGTGTYGRTWLSNTIFHHITVEGGAEYRFSIMWTAAEACKTSGQRCTSIVKRLQNKQSKHSDEESLFDDKAAWR